MSFLKTTRWVSRAFRLTPLVLAAGTCLLRTHMAVAADETSVLEYKVKAGYLYNFAKFVEWPTNALPEPDSPFIIGLLDDGQALPVFQSLLAGKVVNGHPVQVQAVRADRVGSGVHLVFVTRAARKSPEEMSAALRGAATLLVGEEKSFAQRGGSINFFKLDGSVKFEANPTAADRAQLKLGSQLLKLARVVKDGTPTEKD